MSTAGDGNGSTRPPCKIDDYFFRRLLDARLRKKAAPHKLEASASICAGKFSYGVENITVRHWGEPASLSIGDFCSLASEITVFLGGNHRSDWITTFPFGHIFVEQLGETCALGHPSTDGDVRVGNDVWIGHGSTIMSGVTIGDGAIVAANSHVVRNVQPYEIVGGNPARHLRYRFNTEMREKLVELKWWRWPLNKIKANALRLCSAPELDVIENWLKV